MKCNVTGIHTKSVHASPDAFDLEYKKPKLIFKPLTFVTF